MSKNAFLTLEQLRAEVEAEKIDTVLVVTVDMQGRLMGKRYHAAYFLDHHDEAHMCDYLLSMDIENEPVQGYADSSWDSGYGDYTVKPDLATIRRMPWLEATCMVLCDIYDHHGHEVEYSPRAMLKKMVKTLKDEFGLTAKMASELEYYVFDQSYESCHDIGYQFGKMKLAGTYIEDYHILQTTREEPLNRAIRNGLYGAGVVVECTKGEFGPGQEELNTKYDEPVITCDNLTVCKHACKEIALLQGKAVTFMAKVNYDLAGSSCHVHQSLWKADGSSAFLDLEADPEHGMSPTMRSYMAGILKYSREITLFMAPYINSYKRFQQKATFAPTRAVWSHDNRTAGLRVVGHRTKGLRVEVRIAGADCNPYLAYTGMLAAGIAGLREKLELEAPFRGDVYNADGSSRPIREVPKTMREAVAELRNSSMLKDTFGEKVVNHYARAGEWEQEEYDRRITDFELKRCFERC
ncbi:glutamine synthetase [Hyaloraphidium curvatum]|nr:glutamine synthetase [Hyaloraphidium curvatum]